MIVQFDPTINLGTIIVALAFIGGGGAMFWRVGAIERRAETIEGKLDSFITKDTAAVLQQGATAEFAAIRREINGLARLIDAKGH